jgi:hypothetical protein
MWSVVVMLQSPAPSALEMMRFPASRPEHMKRTWLVIEDSYVHPSHSSFPLPSGIPSDIPSITQAPSKYTIQLGRLAMDTSGALHPVK